MIGGESCFICGSHTQMIIFWYVSCFASRFYIQGIMIFIRDWRTVTSVQCDVNKPCKLPIPVRWCDKAFTENKSDSVLIPKR